MKYPVFEKELKIIHQEGNKLSQSEKQFKGKFPFYKKKNFLLTNRNYDSIYFPLNL